MSLSQPGKSARPRLYVEPLERRELLDVAPIGPVLPFDNPEFGNFSFYHEINRSFALADVPSMMRVRTEADVVRVRNDLIQYIWKGQGLPTRMPDEVQLTTTDPNGLTAGRVYPPLANLRQTERLTVTMDHNIRAFVYYLQPVESNGRLAVWHQGHSFDLAETGGYETIQHLLRRGYSVLGSWMPLHGENLLLAPRRVENCTLQLGPVHDDFACLESATFTPMKYFVEPITVALNYVLRKQPFQDVTMIGLSGGGWTTTLYAALDPRVRLSIPVAGTLPEYLRTGPYSVDNGDWEQSGSGIYRLVNVLDLLVLGSAGPGRRVLQVLNKFDDCCFAGVRYRTYLDHVKDAAARLGGSFDVFLDDAFRPEDRRAIHQVSPFALSTAISAALDQRPVQYVDDGENTYWNGGGTDRDTFHPAGVWAEVPGTGFGRDSQVSDPTSGPASARWQFKVRPGTYQVAVTWSPAAARAAAGGAPFTVFDDATPLGTFRLDQRQLPNGFYDTTGGWTILGEFSVRSTRLVVQLTNATDGPVIADGVRIIADPNRSYVRELYRDLLGREPDPAGLEGFTTLLTSGRATREQVAFGILTSQERRELQVRQLYRDLLHREADPEGLAAFATFLRTGGSLNQLKAAILTSAEYSRTRGAADNLGFLRELYRDVLGRTIDLPAQQAFAVLLANNVSRADIALRVLTSDEAHRRTVRGLYERLLDRGPDTAGLSAFVNALSQGFSEEQIITTIVTSAEYVRRSMTGG